MKTRFQNAQRGFDHQFDADRRRQMKNELGVRGQLRQFTARGYFRLNHAQTRMRFDRAQIFQTARGKIVNDDDRFAIGQQALDEVRPDETRAASDQDVFYLFHFSASATASASFWRNSGFSISLASWGFDIKPPSIKIAGRFCPCKTVSNRE